MLNANDNNIGEEQFTCCIAKSTASYKRLIHRQRRSRRCIIENSMAISIFLLLGMSMFSISFGWSWSPPPKRTQDVSFRSSSPATRIKHSQYYSMQLWASSNQQPSRQSYTSSTIGNGEAAEEDDLPIINEVNQQINLLIECLSTEKKKSSTDNNYSVSTTRPIAILKNILTLYTNYCTTYPTPQDRFRVSSTIDRAFRLVTNEAFSSTATPYNYSNSLSWINLGMETLQLQLHSDQFFISASLDERTRFVRLQRPYDAIPKGTWLKALRALTSKDIVSTNANSSSPTSSYRSIKVLSSSTKKGEEGEKAQSEWITPSNAAFRILQRLITGKGIRTFTKKKKKLSSSSQQPQQTTTMKKGTLDERDFNMVLHSYTLSLMSTSSTSSSSNNNNINSSKYMDAAHRVLALQERTPHAPPLSPISYSILLKAYGSLNDVQNIDKCLNHAKYNGIIADIVMVNVVLDAYVNCGMVNRAHDVFSSITTSQAGEEEREGGRYYWPRIKPNSRTYNTLLKGMAYEGDITSAMELSNTIHNQNLWDDITTNTLVKVAVTCGEYMLAEDILTNHTSSTKRNVRSSGAASSATTDHPNVEAYTELLDGYAKNNQLENALRIMSLMSKRDVEPNVYTYTCMVGALARYNKVRQGRKMMTYATETLPLGRRGTSMMELTPTYNAFISGLLSSNNNDNIENNNEARGVSSSPQQSSHSSNIVEVLSVLQEMQDLNIHPNVVTVALVVDGLGKCTPPRCAEARELVQHLEFTNRTRQGGGSAYNYNSQQKGIGEGISLSNNKIATALISAYGKDNDVNSAVEAFTRIVSPDVVALNALLDACCRCDMIKLAFVLFKKHSSFSVGVEGDKKVQQQQEVLIKPDVVTYTTLISACLQLKSRGATKRAISLYNEMKSKWRISPDTILVDTILTAMLSGGPIGFEEEDVKFTLTVLRDGSHLVWDYGQYEKRKKAVRGILVGCSSEIWKNDEYAYGLVSEEQPEDVLFTKKGWNKIDSGFRLWGSGDDYDDVMIQQQNVDDNSSVDEFLASKGWNDIDSGFRIV